MEGTCIEGPQELSGVQIKLGNHIYYDQENNMDVSEQSSGVKLKSRETLWKNKQEIWLSGRTNSITHTEQPYLFQMNSNRIYVFEIMFSLFEML